MKSKVSKFNCVIRAAMSEEADKILSVASLEKLRKFLPDVHASNDDLLPIALDACVVNRFNKNGDGIDSAMAYAIYKNFANKPINIEHNPKNVIGTIISASFLDVNHNEISAEVAKDMKDPFYITLGGVLWKRVSPSVTAYVEDCSNPLSPNHKEVSGSWELAFSDYKLMAREDESRDIEGCEELKEMDEVQASRNHPHKKIYRQLIGETLPIGLGIVEVPAADVRGIATQSTTASELPVIVENTLVTFEATSGGIFSCPEIDKKIEDVKAELLASINKLEADTTLLSSKISQAEKNNVTTIKSTMKISISQITDEALKGGVITASSIQDFISELEKANEDYKGKQAAAEALKQTAEAQRELVSAELASAKQTLETVKAEVDALKAKVKAEDDQKAFSARMGYFDEAYSLSSEVKQVLAKRIRSLASDEEFESFKTEMEIFLTKKDSTSKASQEVLDDVLQDKKAAGHPNGTSVSNEKSELDKAFAEDQFIVEV